MAKFTCVLIAAPLWLAAAGTLAGAAPCDRIVAVIPSVEVFGSSTAAGPMRMIARTDLPAEVCRLGRENGRYRISLEGTDVWVASSQFSGPPARYARPLKVQPGGKPAGVRLGEGPRERVSRKIAVSRKSGTVRARRAW